MKASITFNKEISNRLKRGETINMHIIYTKERGFTLMEISQKIHKSVVCPSGYDIRCSSCDYQVLPKIEQDVPCRSTKNECLIHGEYIKFTCPKCGATRFLYRKKWYYGNELPKIMDLAMKIVDNKTCKRI